MEEVLYLCVQLLDGVLWEGVRYELVDDYWWLFVMDCSLLDGIE